MNRRPSSSWKALTLVMALAVLAAAPSLFAQGNITGGPAPISMQFGSPNVTLGDPNVGNVRVDLTGVEGDGGSVPAVLGGYNITITFDTTKVNLVSIQGGTSTGYTGGPSASTAIGTANSTGTLVIVGSNGGNENAPTGNVSVARLTFTTLATGIAHFTVGPTNGSSIFSAYQSGSPGSPANIGGTGSSPQFTISDSGGGPSVPPPGVPMNPNPPDGATNVLGPNVTLGWTSTNAAWFEVFFGTSSNPPAFNTIFPNSQPVTVQNGVTYYWKIIAHNSAGATAGPVWSFTANSCVTPDAPVVVAPVTVNSYTQYTVSWAPVPNATQYDVDESTDPTFTSGTITTVTVMAPTTSANFIHNVPTETTYYYRVSARAISPGCDSSSAHSANVAVVVEPGGTRAVIPVVASAPGDFGAQFKTQVQMYNPSDATISGLLIYHVEGVTGSDNDPALAYAIQPHKSINYDDLLASMNLTGKGSVDVVATAGRLPVTVVRIFNDGGVNGTSGMTEPMVPIEKAMTVNDEFTFIAPSDPTKSRMNIGVRTLSNGATFDVTVRDQDGVQIGSTMTKTYGPTLFGQSSAKDFLGMTEDLPANATISIKMTAGEAIVYAAPNDNVTNDPSLQVGMKP